MRDGWVADTFEEAAEEFGTHFVEEMRFYFRQGIFTHHPDFQNESDITAERAAPHLIMGTPDQCISQLEMYHEDFGVDYFTIRFRMATGPSMERPTSRSRNSARRSCSRSTASTRRPTTPPSPRPAVGRTAARRLGGRSGEGRRWEIEPGLWQLRLPLPWDTISSVNAFAIARDDGIMLVDAGRRAIRPTGTRW